ncbi:MAG: ABC transporter ATP-binding protein [Gammaproteobacteria bacterium]
MASTQNNVAIDLSQSIIRLDQVAYSYHNRVIFDDINISIPRGKITAIMGPSGSGKTTLLKLITGQLHPINGSVTVNEQEVPKLNRQALFKLRMRMGMMFQSSALLTHLSVFENVAYPLREHTNLSEPMIRSIVLMKLQAVGLRGARDLMPSELSGGMTRRVALARAIVLDPMMIMYDDPFSGQDPVTLGVLMRLIQSLNDGLGISSILVSHDADEIAAIADYIYIIAEGKVKEHGTPDELGRSNNDWTQQLLKGRANGPVSFHYPAVELRNDLKI